jgi:hypothetical protein
MVEQPGPGPGREGEGAAPRIDADPDAGPQRRLTSQRPRWPAARSRRPSWWEVPPQGYLEVESHKGPTRPRALRTLAKAAARAGLSWNPGRPLPVQRFVEAQERARLVFHGRRELPRVTAVASQVMMVDGRLAEAEELLRQAVGQRLAAVARLDAVDQPGAAGQAPVGQTAGQPPAPLTGPGPERPGRQPMLGPWSEAATLAVVAGGEGVLAHVVAADAGVGTVALGLLALAAAVGTVAAAQLAARGIHRLGATPEGSDDPRRRRRLDVAVAVGAVASGMALVIAMNHLRAGAGPAVLGLSLLGLATAASYAAIPGGLGATDTSRWRSVTTRLRRLRAGRRSRRELQAAQARQAAARAVVRQLREELAVLVPQLFAAEQSALLFWRYQVAVGDAAQHAFEQHLAAFTMRRSRGAWRPIVDWWRGAQPVASGADSGFTSVGEGQSDWGDRVARVTMTAKRVLVRRGLIDITHGLRLPQLPSTPPADGNGSSAATTDQAAAGDGHHQSMGASRQQGDDVEPADRGR